MNRVAFASVLAAGLLGAMLAAGPLYADLLVQPHDLIAVYSDMTSEQRMASVDIGDYLLMCRPVDDARVYDAGSPKENLQTFNRDLAFGLWQVKPNVVLLSFSDSANLSSVIETLKKRGAGSVITFPSSTDTHLAIACTCLKDLGCDGAIGSIDVDLSAGTATSDPGQKIVAIQNGVVTIQTSRYPFSAGGEPMPAAFNDDLNRYTLTVKGIASLKAKVTWGVESRDFSTSDLAKGVNLSVAFAGHTPFDAQFAKVRSAVISRQKDQDFFNDTYFNLAIMLKHMAGPEGAAADKLGEAILDHDRTAAEAAATLVVPISHTLKIEAIPDGAK